MRSTRWLFRTLLASFLLAAGCGDDGGGGGGSPDASTPDASTDGATPDASTEGGTPSCPDGTGMVPEGRGEHVAFYDAARKRLLVFGGNVAEPEMCNPVRPSYEEVVWAFYPDCGVWERLEPAGDSPLGRTRMALAYDSGADRVLLFGGRRRGTMGYQNYDEVWAFDLATNTWELLEATGTKPPARNAAAAGYDPDGNRLLVFGGNTSSSGLRYQAVDDTWAFDLTARTWERIDGDPKPPARIFPGGAVLDGKFYVYGGTADFFGPILGDLWALDVATDAWAQVETEEAPDAPRTRFAAQLLADPDRGRLLVLMGHDDTDLGNSNDVYAYDPATGAWRELHPGDQLNARPDGFCDFPADFVTMESDSPERRHMFGAAIGPRFAYVTMGKTDCGNVNDVWSMDLSDGTWQMLSAATEGESCERRGDTDCTTLCF